MHLFQNAETIDRLVKQGELLLKTYHAEYDEDPASFHAEFLRGTAMEGQTPAGIELFTNRADRLLRTFATQVETLKKYRSKGEQHCTVEHVHVHSGGQAVVGSVTARSRDRGVGGKGNGDQ